MPPGAVSSLGQEAAELAASAGLDLDPWQRFCLDRTLDLRSDGKWLAPEAAVVVPRQNGKGGYLEARELAGLFLLGEKFITHSAHQFDTSLEAFRRLLLLIENTPDLDRYVKRVSKSHGEEGIELKSRARIRFRTRTKDGGRGFTGDCVVLDEAMNLPESAHGSLMPTVSARPNPQIIYTGSAVDREEMEHGRVLARVRRRGMSGGDPALFYAEWSIDAELGKFDPRATGPAEWAIANPGLGIRISLEAIEREQRSMSPRKFAVERLGVGDWPTDDDADGAAFYAAWEALTDPDSRAGAVVAFAIDVSPDRSRASIATAGREDAAPAHVEVVENRPGTSWVVPRVRELVERWHPCAVVLDPGSAAGSLLPELEKIGVKVEQTTTREVAQACGAFYDAVVDAEVRHIGQETLNTAVESAAKRPLGDAWAWSRKGGGDVTPLVAVTLALWGFNSFGEFNITDNIW